MLVFCTSNSCLAYYNGLCAFRLMAAFWWRATVLDLVLHYTVNAFSIQTSMAAGQLVGGYVNSSLHLFFVCTAGSKPHEEEFKSHRCFDHLHSHATLLITSQRRLHPAPWFLRHLVSAQLLPNVVDESALPSQPFLTFLLLSEAFKYIKKEQN